MTDAHDHHSLLTDTATAGRRTILRWAQRPDPRPSDEAEKNAPARNGADENPRPPLPEDVASLFRQADFEPIPYVDFSASRSALNAETRHRKAVEQRNLEARAKADAEQAAAESESAAREAREAARFHAAQARWAADRHLEQDLLAEEAARERAQQRAEHLSRKAAAERAESSRRAQSLRAADQLVQREVEELTRAQADVSQQHRSPGQQAQVPPASPLPARKSSADASSAGTRDYLQQPPDAPSTQSVPEQVDEGEDMLPARFSQRRDPRLWLQADEAASTQSTEAAEEDAVSPVLLSEGTPSVPAHDPSSTETLTAVDQYARWKPYADPRAQPGDKGEEDVLPNLAEADQGADDGPSAARSPEALEEGDPTLPSWIAPQKSPPAEPGRRSPLVETLQHSRERVASRWYALRELFDPTARERERILEAPPEDVPPLLAIFSVAGGVGKTSLAASLARALASHGERVLLIDTTGHGVLPFHFGARDLRAGLIRTFAPPAGSPDQPIHLVSYRLPPASLEEGPGEALDVRIRRDSKGFSRVIVDVASTSAPILQDLVLLGAQVLVPVASAMNSVLTLPGVQRLCAGIRNNAGAAVEPFFLLTQFDPTQPLQLDIREILQLQLGDRLLPFVVRRSPAVAEALAEGMTVLDYAPNEGIAKDFLQTAAWVRTLAEPAREGMRQARWSER